MFLIQIYSTHCSSHGYRQLSWCTDGERVVCYKGRRRRRCCRREISTRGFAKVFSIRQKHYFKFEKSLPRSYKYPIHAGIISN